jgi:hypothetical protein
MTMPPPTRTVPSVVADETASDGVPERSVRDAAWNAVAVASVAWQQSVGALRHILDLARGHGLTVDDLAEASGLSTAFINELLEQVD